MGDQFDFEGLNKRIQSAIRESFKGHFEEVQPSQVYESIKDYETKTGKRFRMTKPEKSRGLSREEAFQERFNG